MTPYNLMDSDELAEIGYYSKDPLAEALGLSLQHYIEESEYLHRREKELSDRVNDLTDKVVPDLETQVERLRATIAALEDAIKAKKKA